MMLFEVLWLLDISEWCRFAAAEWDEVSFIPTLYVKVKQTHDLVSCERLCGDDGLNLSGQECLIVLPGDWSLE